MKMLRANNQSTEKAIMLISFSCKLEHGGSLSKYLDLQKLTNVIKESNISRMYDEINNTN